VGVDEVDPEKFHWFNAYKNTPFGKRFFAMGHDGTPEAKKELIQFKQEIMTNPAEHAWIEASGRLQQIIESWNIPKVPFEEVKILLPGKQLEQVDEYSYRRNIGGQNITKTVYGYPKIPQSWQSELLKTGEGKGFSSK
jgi:hypothetical protein